MKRKELTLLFLKEEGRVLLAMKKRGFGVGRWNGVGGKIEAGETPEEAAVRECYEEILVTPLDFHKVAELTFDELHEGERKIMFVHVYLCDNWQGTPSETEEMKPEWYTFEAVPYEQCWSDDVHWLPLVLKGKKLTANFVMNDSYVVTEAHVEEVNGF